jgi:beta-lactam-binding protein with PASTA domain
MNDAMAEPPPRDPRDPADDETVISDGWPESEVYVEPREQVREEIVEEPPRRMPTIWPWLLALLLLVLGGLGAYYLLSRDDDDSAASTTTAQTTTASTTTAEQTSVPDVVGTTSSEATETLRGAGFEVNLVSVPSDRPPGTVVAQAPAPGSEQREGSTVRLNVAEAATGTTTGTTTTGETTTEAATTSPPTTTTAPTPTPPRPAVVPDVVGQELADAARSFGDEGLKFAVAYVPSREAAGRVVAQAQPPGTERRRGDTVQLNISIGAEPPAATSVPRTAGQTLERGRDLLEEAGFEVLALTVGDRDVENESTILSQSPAGGASVPRGSLVLLYV